MYPRYYALRRVNPYRGAVQIVEAGDALAHSQDGLTWHLKAADASGWVRPSGVWVEGEGLKVGHAANLEDLIPALEARPSLPFPFFDTRELWLLDKETGLPLAILATDRAGQTHREKPDPEWHPFILTYTGFHSPVLGRRDERHRDLLARQVNHAARPYPAAQWFQRDQAGEGVGLEGLRLESDWKHRRLPASAFPELLVRETWNSRVENSVIADYHAHLAPILLCWPRLGPAIRERLEAQACENPRWLARIHRLVPRWSDPERMRAALVAARLQEALGEPEPEWN